MSLIISGLKGDPGRSFIIGSGPPGATDGADGDSWVDIANGYALWSRSAGSWAKIGALLQTINGKTGVIVQLAASDVGAVAADQDGYLSLSSFPTRTAQVTQAIRPVLVDAGTTFGTFLQSLDGPDGKNGEWEMIYVEPTAPIGGKLYNKLLDFLQAKGQTMGAATLQLQQVWLSAAQIVP